MADWRQLKQKALAAADEFGSYDPAEAEIEFMSAIKPDVILALIAENERLQAERDKFSDEAQKLDDFSETLGLEIAESGKREIAHRAERDQLRAEVEALRKDAKRYRFVRELAWYVDQAAYVYEIGNSRSPWTSERAPVDADDIEMAIDAAMGKGGRADG